MKGYVKLHRKFLDWGWYTDTNTKAVFLHLLLIANHKDTFFQGKRIRRGQCVISYPSLAEKLGLTKMQIRTACEHLSTTGEIHRQGTNKYTLITIQNYDDYQSEADDTQETDNTQTARKQHANNIQITRKQHADNTQITHKQHSNNIQITPPEECKECKEYREYNPPLPPQGEMTGDDFSLFWQAYPKKVGKANCLKWFRSHKPSHEAVLVMVAAVNAQKQSRQWVKNGGQFIPNPQTWLNGERWNDVLPGAEAPAKPNYEGGETL